MYTLFKQGKTVSAAADIAVGEMEPAGEMDTARDVARAQAKERLRSKFRSFRAEKETAPRAKPREPQAPETPSTQILEQVRQHVAIVSTPEMRDAIRWVRDNKESLLEVKKRVLRARKP
jgi:hypothetical protein